MKQIPINNLRYQEGWVSIGEDRFFFSNMKKSIPKKGIRISRNSVQDWGEHYSLRDFITLVFQPLTFNKNI